MTKKWSSTASMDGKTKRRASKDERREADSDLMRWLKDEGATYSDREGNVRRVGDDGPDDPTHT